MTVRRVARAALLFAAFLAVLVPAVSSGGAPYTGGASLTVTSSDPCIGGRNTYAGAGFVAGETVVLTVDGRTVGSAVAGSDGTFSVVLALPTSLRGTVVVTATGSKASASTTITVYRSCSSSAAGGGSTGGGAGGDYNGGSPAVTGVAVAALVVVALVLLVGGALLVITGRRRGR